MTNEKKHYAKYIFNRGLQTLWKGDAAEKGSMFRSVAMTSDDFNWTNALFQVYVLEGVGQGIKDGKFAGSDGNPKVLFDSDFQGLQDAAKKFEELVTDAKNNGFRPITFWDTIEFEQKLSIKS